MREIKFRAWNKKTKKMVNLNAITPLALSPLLNEDGVFVPFNQGPVMQYTGLKDSEGVDIYEGDLFGVTNLNGEFELVGEVIFDTDLAQFTIKYTNGGWAELWQHLNEKTNKAREVIGNIYENPELLK